MNHDDIPGRSVDPDAASSTGPAHYQVVTDRQVAERRAKGARRMGFGALCLGAGLLITIVTLAHFATSGFAILAFGPIIGGALQMISGHRLHRAATAGAPSRDR